MKARVITREEIKTEAFLECKEDFTWQATAAILYAFHLQGYRKKRLQDMYDTIKSVYEMPPVMGKYLRGQEVIDFIKNTYGIDVTQLKVNADTREELMKQ